MHFEHAVTRKPGKTFSSGLTTASLGTPNYEKILKQHHDYVATLQSLGVEVEILPPLSDFPDAYFVEDVAVVTPHIAIITNPGAEARSGETTYIENALSKFRQLARINPPGTLDGGDVLQVGNMFYIGVSARTNEEGANQLCQILQQYGHSCMTILVSGGLHLKSDISYIGHNTMLITKSLINLDEFAQYNRILIDDAEAYAANSLLVNDHILTPKGFPQTRRKLLEAQFNIIEIETSEMQKMDGGLSCLSLRF